MTVKRVERAASKVVEAVFGGGYISQAASEVYVASFAILSTVPEEKIAATSEAIIGMCRVVGMEAAQVGFEISE